MTNPTFDEMDAKVTPVDGGQLLEDLVTFYTKYVRIREDEYVVMAAWVLHTHAFAAFKRTPYVSVSSPSAECGKTQLLEVTEHLVPNPWLTMSITNAVLARKIDTEKPVLMVDEFDNLRAGDKELLASVLATINSGYKASGSRSILEPSKGGGWVCKNLSTFCPKVLSGISGLAPTTKSRCIPIAMERMLPSDRVVEIDEYVIEPEGRALYNRCQDWAGQNLKKLRDARPAAPSELGHRQREVCRPLFAIADLIGAGWEVKLRAAIVRLFTTESAQPTDDIKEQLLRDIKEVFGDADRITSADLAAGLVALDSSPWSAWGRNQKPITTAGVAGQLKGFKIFPGTIRISTATAKGYYRSAFELVWDRYIRTSAPSVPPTPDSSRHTVTTRMDIDDSAISQPSHKEDVTARKPDLNHTKQSECDGVTGKKPERGNGVEKPTVKTMSSCPTCGSHSVDSRTTPPTCFTCTEKKAEGWRN